MILLNNMFINNLSKGISTPIAILVIMVAIVIGGGLVLWQYPEIGRETIDVAETQLLKTKTAVTNSETDAETEDAISTSEIDTSGWKIYQNEEYGFEIKYPTVWKIQEYGTKGQHVAFDPEKVYLGKIGLDTPYGMIEIIVTGPTGPRHYSYEVDIAKDSKIKARYTEHKCVPPDAGGSAICTSFPELFVIEYNIGKHGFGIDAFGIDIFCSFFTEKQQEQYQKIVNQMLSTFKFIE